MAVSDYSTTADNNTSISGINIAEGCPPGNMNDAVRQLMADIRTKGNSLDASLSSLQTTVGTKLSASDFFPAGTRMLFHQTAAPTGWTKQTGFNDCALRMTDGNGGGIGGNLPFLTAFAASRSFSASFSGVSAATVLTADQLPSHAHGISSGMVHLSGSGAAHSTGGGVWTFGSLGTVSTDGAGGNAGHKHGISGTASGALDMNVRYTDIIICQKN